MHNNNIIMQNIITPIISSIPADTPIAIKSFSVSAMPKNVIIIITLIR